jgi:hypothetical protein
METTVKCKKCGRVLKNPASVVLGMGPKCAGVSPSRGGHRLGIRQSSGKEYGAVGMTSATQMSMMPTEPPARKLSRKELARRLRDERRRAFEQRQTFQCGMVVRTKSPLVYEPVGEQEWRDSLSGKVLSQEQLRAYLARYRFI